MSEEKPKRMCDCCGVRKISQFEYREIDTMVSKYFVCNLCWNLKNEYWLAIHRGYGTEKAREELRNVYYDDNWEEMGIEPPKFEDWNPKLISTKLMGYTEDGLEFNLSDDGNIWWSEVDNAMNTFDIKLYYPDEWAEYWERKEEE